MVVPPTGADFASIHMTIPLRRHHSAALAVRHCIRISECILMLSPDFALHGAVMHHIGTRPLTAAVLHA